MEPPEPSALARAEAEVERYQAALDQIERIQSNYSRLVEQLMDELEQEKSRSDALLRNVLPEAIIERLNAGETVIADRFDDVAIVFSDLVGFTETSSMHEAAVVVTSLNALFSRFDAACEDLGVEKIKTIGDAYMAAAFEGGGGSDHVRSIAELALRMAAAVDEVNVEVGMDWRMRVGIHAGPAVAGIIGTRKYVYDVWGDTVNVASRLQTASEPGRIHLTRTIADRLGEGYRFDGDGVVELKGKGPVETCFLVGGAGGR